MTMVIQEKFYTAEEFWEFSHRPENVDKRLELVEGEIREMTPAGGEHGEITFDFGLVIGNFVKERKLGRVTAAETGYILYTDPITGKDTVRGPDIGFVSIERAPQPFSGKFIPMPPDLAIEVVSPDDRADEIDAKVQLYLRYGVRMVVVVYPSSKSVVIHKADQMYRLNTEDTLDFADSLPGFTLKVSEIFPK
jgi:Uma2 family endonuclease